MKTSYLMTLSLVSIILGGTSQGNEPTWRSTEALFYTIQYTEDDADSIDRVVKQLQSFHDSFCEAANMDPAIVSSSKIVLELHPASGTNVRLGHAGLDGGLSGSRDKLQYRGKIQMSGPKAHDGSSTSSNGHPMDQNYFNKLLVHEVAPIYLSSLAFSRGGRFSGPAWFVQGSEEYFGVFHSDDYWKESGYAYYHRRISKDPSTIDVDFGFHVNDPYNDGFIVFNFLRDEFGEDAIIKLVTSSEVSFGKRMRAATGIDFDDFAERFGVWKQSAIRRVAKSSGVQATRAKK